MAKARSTTSPASPATRKAPAGKPKAKRAPAARAASGPADDAPFDGDSALDTGSSGSSKAPGGRGKQLVIVESTAKAKTINKYLGSGYTVLASIGHVRDLPSRNPKGVKNPVPGVDLENDFAPTYEVMDK